jgi:hypothetical protein
VPAKDRYHDAVRRALQKDGWQIVAEQLVFIGKERNIVIDLRAVKEGEQAVLIEVKSFLGSALEALANALGKLLIYRYILAEIGEETPLWIAIPDHAYNDIGQQDIWLAMQQQTAMNVLVFSAEREEIMRWMPYVTL